MTVKSNEASVPLWNQELLPPTPGRYKVITMKDRFFGGKFNPELLQSALNSYADDGWKLIEAVSADIPGVSRSEIVMIMERIGWDEESAFSQVQFANGVLFIQGDLPEFEMPGFVEANIDRQNAQLGQIRELLANIALTKKANVVTNFTNSQRGHKPLTLLNPFKWDTETLSGFGQLAFVPEDQMGRVFSQLLDGQGTQSASVT